MVAGRAEKTTQTMKATDAVLNALGMVLTLTFVGPVAGMSRMKSNRILFEDEQLNYEFLPEIDTVLCPKSSAKSRLIDAIATLGETPSRRGSLRI